LQGGARFNDREVAPQSVGEGETKGATGGRGDPLRERKRLQVKRSGGLFGSLECFEKKEPHPTLKAIRGRWQTFEKSQRGELPTAGRKIHSSIGGGGSKKRIGRGAVNVKNNKRKVHGGAGEEKLLFKKKGGDRFLLAPQRGYKS